MPEYLVTMNITFPPGMSREHIGEWLRLEANAAEPYLSNGTFARAFSSYGDHTGSHGHVALWNAPDYGYVTNAYSKFPLVRAGYATNVHVQPLGVNPNDPQAPDTRSPETPLVWDVLSLVWERGKHEAMEHGVWVVPGLLSVHMHEDSQDPHQVHVMAHDGKAVQKIAELGPPTGDSDARIPGYVDLLYKWGGLPVHARKWQARILSDNKLVTNVAGPGGPSMHRYQVETY